MEELNRNYTVYKHETPNGKIYIGITSIEPETRWRGGNGYSRNKHFYSAIKKYGWGAIKHEIIAKGLTRTEASEEERRLIALYQSSKPDKGYNMTSGGEVGYTLTEETRKKISEAHKGLRYNIGVPFTEERKRHLREHHADYRGEKNPRYGIKWTPEQIEKRQAHRVYKTGAENPRAKPILQIDKEGNIVKRWGSIVDASKEFCRTSIKDVLRGKYKHHRGYEWRYDNGDKRD